jgi:hypothetical protein
MLPTELEREARRLLELCAEKGLTAVLPELGERRDLQRALAGECYRVGMLEEGQYLDYLANPYD